VSRTPGLLLAAVLLAAAAGAQEPSPFVVERMPVQLAGEWSFRIGHDPAWASPFREKRNWQRIRVPGGWERQGYPEYNGHAWYKVPLVFDSRLAGEEFGLDLGLIGDVDEVFLNGRPVGGTGAFPPRFDKATLARRFYRIPKDAIRFGERNELAIHVYNDARFGGLLGPSPRIERFDDVLRRQFLRDLLAYCLATLIATLAAFHLILFGAQRSAYEHLFFTAFLLAISAYLLTYTHWGPAQLVGHSANFRINVLTMLLGIALFPTSFYRMAHRKLPVAIVAMQTLLALGAAFALVWREEGDLYLWVHLAEAAILITGALVLKTLWTLARHRNPWTRALLVTALGFVVGVVLDVLVDIGILPRLEVTVGELYYPLALIPFALVFSLSLAHNWMERRWGEPLDSTTGLMPRDRFVDRLASELERSRRSRQPLALALLRFGSGAEDTGTDQFVARAVPVIRRALRQIDMLSRYDRDTFALLLADTEERAAMTILERLRRTVAESATSGQGRPVVTAGVAQHRPSRHVAADELIEAAEAALYAAIAEGGDCTATAP
jgi:diguanylate cyclase (GGDEF)-like protein